MTRDQIIHQRRVRVLEHAGETGNVAETCRVFGISRKTFYEWRKLSDAYGLHQPRAPSVTSNPGREVLGRQRRRLDLGSLSPGA